MQALCNALSTEKIDTLLRKWLAHLPHLFSCRDRQAGYRYDLSILQIELSDASCGPTGDSVFDDTLKRKRQTGYPSGEYRSLVSSK